MKTKTINLRHAAGLVSGMALLTACTSADPVYTQFHREAGALADGGQFGNATVNNLMIQSGERDYTYALGTRFAQEVPNTVTFAFNSAVLDANAQAVLRQQAHWIRQFPEVRFRVYGHTDLVGSPGYNKSLGLRRAQAVVAYLTTHGISRSRLEAVASFGETQPVIATQSAERRNRRTVTEVTGFVKTHRNVLDGKYAQIIYRDYVASARSQTTLTGLDQTVAQAPN
ncbi:OmpA family protein [Sulfitobacter sp. D35]|uniref:OmpA family protein n=1 Tax=Sulfitobacter sp. D35 TaxID=3083252 RepID=UPI00296FE1E3|nr:OmpA family protein [Sulfitobacter sp. D35]MDW4499486.1 OmpA family protein [Sulfitobacter sp. D35]